jgi:hypothetical protein
VSSASSARCLRFQRIQAKGAHHSRTLRHTSKGDGRAFAVLPLVERGFPLVLSQLFVTDVDIDPFLRRDVTGRLL